MNHFIKHSLFNNKYLFVKVGVEHNQVEVALQALYCSVQKVVFGAASLRNKTISLFRLFLRVLYEKRCMSHVLYFYIAL